MNADLMHASVDRAAFDQGERLQISADLSFEASLNQKLGAAGFAVGVGSLLDVDRRWLEFAFTAQ